MYRCLVWDSTAEMILLGPILINVLVKFWGPPRFFRQNRANREFQSATNELILSRIQKFQEVLKSASLGLET